MADPVRRSPAFVRAWQQISPSLVPILAVLTALLITIPFMIVTGGGGDVGKGLNIAGTAYSALLEGSLGVVVNRQVGRDNLDQFLALAQNSSMKQADLRRLSRSMTDLSTVGVENARRYGDLLTKLGDISA